MGVIMKYRISHVIDPFLEIEERDYTFFGEASDALNKLRSDVKDAVEWIEQCNPRDFVLAVIDESKLHADICIVIKQHELLPASHSVQLDTIDVEEVN
jgi:hypothetical protein